MERADPGQGVRRVTPWPDVTDLRMQQAMHGRAAGDDATADAGAHGDVDQVLDVARGAPAVFGQCGGTDVGVETDGAVECSSQGAGDIGIAPARFRRARDVPIERVRRVEVHGPEGCHAERRRYAMASESRAEELAGGVQRGGRVAGRQPGLFEQHATGVADGTHELRAAGFKGAVDGLLCLSHGVQHSRLRNGYNGRTYPTGSPTMNAAALDPAKPAALSTSARAMIEKLIGFNTVSRDSNLGLIEYVRDYLAGLGAVTRLTHDTTGRKANLFATLGDSPRPGLMLSGHTDVVPVDGQSWDTDPFKVTEKDGKLFARGSADMKGFIGIALAQAPQVLEALQRGRLDAPLHYALSYDEEVGCLGVRGLIRDLEQNNIRPAGCVVGEPTSMQPIVAHKGMNRFCCSVRGREAHSSYVTHGVNAIEYAARLIVHIRAIAERLAATEQRDFGFTVPYTTLSTGLIRGGIAANVIPKECVFSSTCARCRKPPPRRCTRRSASAPSSLRPKCAAWTRKPASNSSGPATPWDSPPMRATRSSSGPCSSQDTTAPVRCRTAPRRACSSAWGCRQ